jgi:cytoskeletal protein CcmA (bactofilin family)
VNDADNSRPDNVLPDGSTPGGGTPKRGIDHLDEMTCLLYIERQLDRVRGQEVSGHAQECVPCRTLLRALERESRLLTRAMLEEEEPLPSRLAQFQQRARRSMQWIWGLAFGLAATGLYALYTGYIEPWQTQLDQAGFGSTNLVSLLVFQGAFWKGWQSMVTLLELVAMLTLGGFGLAFFRRRARRGSVLALMLAGFCGAAAMVMPPTASASDFRKGDFVEVKQNEVVKGDVFLFGHRARMNGTVEGDVYLFSEDGTVTGTVKGDVIAFTQSLHITGHVDGNVRSFNNNMTISGDVARNVLTFDESLNLDATGKVGGSITAFVKTLSLDGSLGRDLLVFGEHTGISGKIGGGVHAKGRSLDLASTAQIDGHVYFEGGTDAEVSQNAKLAFPIEFHKLEHKPKYMEGHYYVWQVIWLACFVLFGLVLFVVMPTFSQEAVLQGERYGACLGLGVLVSFGAPIAAVIACVTVVGLFVGLAGLFLWWASLFYAQTIVGGVVGRWLMGPTRDTWPLIGRMAVGLTLVRLCTTIPEIGGWIKFAVVLWGVGAISLALYRRFQPAIAAGLTVGPYVPPVLPPNTTIGGAQPA